jgi:hypothetical protein
VPYDIFYPFIGNSASPSSSHVKVIRWSSGLGSVLIISCSLLLFLYL